MIGFPRIWEALMVSLTALRQGLAHLLPPCTIGEVAFAPGIPQGNVFTNTIATSATAGFPRCKPESHWIPESVVSWFTSEARGSCGRPRWPNSKSPRRECRWSPPLARSFVQRSHTSTKWSPSRSIAGAGCQPDPLNHSLGMSWPILPYVRAVMNT